MNTTNTLYLSLDVPDRSKTQLAYQANYFPFSQCSDTAQRLISWRSKRQLYKSMILSGLNEEMTLLTYAPSNKPPQQWAIHWGFNNIPTQIEWERKSLSYIIECDFRVIADGSRVVIFNF
jgi:hypothetical protein